MNGWLRAYYPPTFGFVDARFLSTFWSVRVRYVEVADRDEHPTRQLQFWLSGLEGVLSGVGVLSCSSEGEAFGGATIGIARRGTLVGHM